MKFDANPSLQDKLPRRYVALAVELFRRGELSEGQLARFWRTDRVGLERDAEKAAYVDLAADLEDGEAMTIAIAAERRFAVAPDDRKARRIAERYRNSLLLVRNTDILRNWVLEARADDATVRTVLNRVETVDRFRPANDDPLRDWWAEAISS